MASKNIYLFAISYIFGSANDPKETASMLTEVVEPVLNNLEFIIVSNEAGFFVSKA